MLQAFSTEKLAELLPIDEGRALTPSQPNHFIGDVRMQDLANQMGLEGVEVYAVFFDRSARTRPHINPSGQLLCFVRGSGFVVFPGEDEQVVEEGNAVVVPACELHMHGATETEPVCHVAARMTSPTHWNPRVPSEGKEYLGRRGGEGNVAT